MTSDPLPFTLILPDIEGYSSGGEQRHIRLQDGLRGALDKACAAGDLRRSLWKRQGTGDGELALVPPDVPKPRILTTFVHELQQAMEGFNADKADGQRLRLRLAVDHGEVLVNDLNFAGNAPIRVNRLSNSPALKRALRLAKRTDLAIIVSNRFYEDVVRDGRPGIRPETYHRVRVKDKEFDEFGWIHLPGEPDGGAAYLSGPADDQGDHTQATGQPGRDEPAAPDDLGHVVIKDFESNGALAVGGDAIQEVIGVQHNYGRPGRRKGTGRGRR